MVLNCFNKGEFFNAHETLEDVRRGSGGLEKEFLQALIQVALHHHSTGNLVDARSLLKRSEKNLVGYSEGYMGLKLSALRKSLSDWRDERHDRSAATSNGNHQPEYC
jgi:uncharacterized protein